MLSWSSQHNQTICKCIDIKDNTIIIIAATVCLARLALFIVIIKKNQKTVTILILFVIVNH